MRSARLEILKISIAFIVIDVPTIRPFVIDSRKERIGAPKPLPLSNCLGYCKPIVSTTRLADTEQDRREGNGYYPGRTNGGYTGNNTNNDNSGNSKSYNGSPVFPVYDTANTANDEGNDRINDTNTWQQPGNGGYQNPPPPPRAIPSPDRAISIVSELKANAALFAAFAYGSLNLPSTLTVSESKVTSVTTSLSISRPLPDSDLIRTFVVLDVCTLCLMISCVAASQLLIYRLTDGSYEDIDDNYYGSTFDSGVESFDGNGGSRRRKNSRESALGRLVTTYKNEFTVARISFDLGLVTLLLAVGVRSLAIFDEDIVVPVAIVIGTTAVFLAFAYLTTYIEVFRTAENLTSRPLFSIPFPFLNKDAEEKEENAAKLPDAGRENQIASLIVLPISLVSVLLGLYFGLSPGSDSSGSNLSRLGPYDVTSGATKLRVVTDKIDSEKGKPDAKGKNQRNKEQQKEQRRESRSQSRKDRAKEKAEAAEASKKKATEAEAKKKADDEAKKRAEEEAKKKAEDEAAAKLKAEVAVKAKTEAAAEAAKKKALEEAAAAKAKAEALAEAAKKKSLEEAAAATTPAATTF